MKCIQIDAELESLIPPLSEEEERALAQLLAKHGCQQPLVAWKSSSGPILIDGHHRYAVCQKLDIKFSVVEMEFKNRDEVILWMIRNQLGRRNMTSYQKASLALKMKSSGDKMTTDRIAELCGLSRTTLHRVDTLNAEADDELKALLKTGAISVFAAYNRIHPETAPPPTPARVPVAPSRPMNPTVDAIEVTKESLIPRGKTMLNGELVDDPDDVYAMRQAGKIPQGHVPVMETNISPPEPDDLEIAEMTEEEWIESLYARPFLSEIVRDRFDRAAKHFRLVAQAVAALRGECRAAIKAVGLQQSHLPFWPGELWRVINRPSPESWIPCPPTLKGGCDGTGELKGIGPCPKCKGDGFLIR